MPGGKDQDLGPQYQPGSLVAANMTAAPPTTAVATATTNESEIPHHAYSSSRRKEKNWSNEIAPTAAEKEDQQRQPSSPSFPALTFAGTEEREPLRFQSPLSFSHNQQHTSIIVTTDVDNHYQFPDYSQLHHNHAGSDDTCGIENSQYHTTYPSYHRQDSHSNFQSAVQRQQHYYPEERSSPSHLSTPDTSLKDKPSALTDSTQNTTSSRVDADLVLSPSLEGDIKPFTTSNMNNKPRKGILKKEPGSGIKRSNISKSPRLLGDSLSSSLEGDINPYITSNVNKPREGILKKEHSSGIERSNISKSPPSLGDKQKQSATNAHLKGILKKESPRQYEDQLDFEPIPLNEMASIPRLSSSETATLRPPAYPHIMNTASVSHSHDSFPRESGQAPMLPDSFAAAPQASEAQTSPAIPPQFKMAMQSQQKKPALSRRSSGSTTCSAEGEGSSWERRLNELIEFKRKNDHCEVPQSYPENASLGIWVNKQRMEHKNRIEGKKSSLTDYRLERLESIGFRWAKRKGQASWEEKFNELVAYKARFGNCLVPTKYKDNTALGRWVSTQRSEYKKYMEGKERTPMNPDKIRRLESLGFAWFLAL